MARSAALLLWAQALGLTGAQPSQLTQNPPWTPMFQTETVTLTCRGSGAPGPTEWYINGRLWPGEESDHVDIYGHRTESKNVQCRSPGAGLSPTITLSFSNDWVVLQTPAQALLEGDTLPLRCRGWKDTQVTQVQFLRGQEVLGRPSPGATLLLFPLQLHHGGRYRCRATVHHIFAWEKESAPVTVVVQELFSVPVLSLEGPAEPPEGAPLALRCVSHPSHLRPLASLQYLFYRDGAVVGGPQGSPELRLPAVGLTHSGNYSCEVRTETATVWKHSTPVTVTVYRVPVSGVSLVAQPPGAQMAEGDRLVLLCLVAAGTGPLSFSWYRQGSAAPLATGPRYVIPTVQRRDGGRYHCMATNGGTAANSPPLWVTVLVPVAGATISVARMEPSVPAGESLNLSCSVRAGTEPVTFTWLRDGQELGSGPILSLGTVGLEHAGTYRCLATNRLSTHRTFEAHSPALNLSVTQLGWGRQQRGTATAAGLSVSLLLLLSAAVAWYLWRRHAAAGKSRGRDPAVPPEPEGHRPEPTAPPGPPEDVEVLYTHVVVTEQRGGCPRPGSPQEPAVTYAVLPGPQARLRLPSDTYENVP